MVTPKPCNHSKTKFMNSILDDEFHPCAPICTIPSTSTKKKENIFAKFRPQPNTVLDYNISQTDTKLDDGNTKIHLQETIARYVHNEAESKPKRLRVRKTKYFSGGPPKWIFVDELWLREQEKMQKERRMKFKKIVKKRLKEARHLKKFEHERTVGLAGPEWYQELSPKQLVGIDNLENCILKDLAEGTICNTQENIAYLGLVLGPNHRHIKKALKNCCKCPVEFLLILYQLINPNRTTYSINDRLLLSAVVHLTMMDTLRELHIRIPSPPKVPAVTEKARVKKKKIKYESPYMVPFTFEREPPKFSAIYTNKHVQRPQSSYFCYLEQLKTRIKETTEESPEENTDILADGNKLRPETVDIEYEIELELRAAQRKYEQLVDFRPVPKLLKPSRYISCNNFRNKTSQSGTEEIVDDTHYCICGAEAEPWKCSVSCECGFEPCTFPEDKSESELCVCAPKKNTCGCVAVHETKDSCVRVSENKKLKDLCQEQEQKTCLRKDGCYFEDQSLKSTCGCSSKYEEPEDSWVRRVSLMQGDNNEQTNQTEENGIRTKSCNFDGTGKNHSGNRSPLSSEVKKISSGSDNVTGNNSNSHKKEPCKHNMALKLYNKLYPLIRPGGNKLMQSCSCKEKCRQFIQSPLCLCKRCRYERRMKNITYVITGTKETESRDVIPIIDRVIEGKLCKCLKKYENKVTEFELDKEVEDKILCKCHKAVNQMLDTPFCQCSRCQHDRKSRASKFIIKGVKQTDSEILRIIDGISTGKPCECIKEYNKRSKKYETYKQGKDLMVSMKQQEDKFVIGGVASTRRGPKYVITGMRPHIDCSCAKQVRHEAKEKHMQAIMPHVPRGRIVYQIVGTRQTREGNVYILESALPTPDCDCMALFKSFKEQHSPCMDLYEQYLIKMRDEYNEFMKEMLPPSGSRRSSRVSGLEDQTEEVVEENTENETQEIVKDEESEAKVEGYAMQDNTVIVNESESQKLACVKQTDPYDSGTRSWGTGPVFCNCGNPYYCMCCECHNIQKADCEQCTCGGQVIECVDCTCGEEAADDKEEQVQLKRFFIFEKILCNPKWQRNVIKKALLSMAEDNFPLAKLPESYKLPHFKLWMQMRCGMFWTQEGRYSYVFDSKKLWRHCDTCDAWKQQMPVLNISKEKAHNLNWFHANYVRNLVAQNLEKFYRVIKQNRIHFGREFFPTTFSYEFPFKTWRDCYFAYTPTKEADVLARFVWQKHDFKNFADFQRFCGLS